MWRSSGPGGSGGGGAYPPSFSSRDRFRAAAAAGAHDGDEGDALFGSIEDAEALIRLGRQRGRWSGMGVERDARDGAGRVGEEDRVGGEEEEASPGGGEGGDGICVSLPHMLAK